MGQLGGARNSYDERVELNLRHPGWEAKMTDKKGLKMGMLANKAEF